MSDTSNKAVFLSYASQDADAARRICDALRAAGVEVWFDQSELRGGDAWDQKIRKQIKECALFVPVISANTQARREGYFRREWKLAVDRTHDMDEALPFLVPVVIDGTKDTEAFVPEKFREVQWTRLVGGARTDAFAQRIDALLRRSGANAGGAPQVATTPEPPPESPSLATRAQRPARGVKTRMFMAVLVAGLAIGGGVSLYQQWERAAAVRRLHEELLPDLDRRIAAQDVMGAFKVALEAERLRPADGELRKRWQKAVQEVAVESDPPGADVYVKPFHQPDMEWRHLGQTPLTGVRLPLAFLRWRVEKPGFAPLDVQRPIASRKVTLTLRPSSTVPAEMVWVNGGAGQINSTGLRGLRLPDYLIDRCEVTNRQFKQFVDAGGYARPEWWRHPFVRVGATLDHAAAMAEFRDGTGQPGPASWKNGTFPDGAADLPVTGVSWFEAAAYAEWAGKRLPSVYHWRHAGRTLTDNDSIVPLSNFDGKGIARGGTYQGVAACGAYDMAGNVKEWCWNEAAADMRYLLGGSWREPDYMFVQSDALSPFDRSDSNGFRCIKFVGTETPPAEVDARVAQNVRDYLRERPVSDEVFSAFLSLYSYDKGPLDARVENVDDGDPRWRKEYVSYRAAYGDERVPAYVFLPKNATPPYQTIVFFPGAGARQATSSATLREIDRVAVLVASGRALIFPIYKGTYERSTADLRGTAPNIATAAYRDWLIATAKDLRRSIDYVETRSDLQATKLAYVGSSWGGALGALLPAVEPRIKVNILIIGGFYSERPLPEADQLNFAPRITVPTLMLGGRYDFRFPLETSQRPMFRFLGAPPEHKRHVLFDTGHALKSEQIASAAYAWLDQYLGLVK